LDGGGRRRLGGGEYGVADGGGTTGGRPAVGGEYGVAECGAEPYAWGAWGAWGEPYGWGEPSAVGDPYGAEGPPEPSALPRCRAGGGGRGMRRGVTNESV
jgi:hypothetical protein